MTHHLVQLVATAKQIHSIAINESKSFVALNIDGGVAQPVKLTQVVRDDLARYKLHSKKDKFYLVSLCWIDGSTIYRIVSSNYVNRIKKLDDISALSTSIGTFGWAMEQMRFGFAVTRRLWMSEAKTKEQQTFVYLTDEQMIEPPRNRGSRFAKGAMINQAANFVLCDRSHNAQFYKPNTNDCLANDWEIAP